MAAAVVTWRKGRKGDILILALYLIGLLSIGYYTRHQVNSFSYRNCLAIENLKGGQRDAAQATIDGDLGFLKLHPGGTADFPEAVVRADIAAKQSIVDRYPPRECPQP